MVLPSTCRCGVSMQRAASGSAHAAIGAGMLVASQGATAGCPAGCCLCCCQSGLRALVLPQCTAVGCGPVKVLVTDRPHRRTTGLVDLTSGASALLAWFPASWAAKLLPNFLRMPPRMRRNHKKSTSHARNVPVTRLQWKEQNSCSKQSNLLPKPCLVFVLDWMKTFKWLDASRSLSMDTHHP